MEAGIFFLSFVTPVFAQVSNPTQLDEGASAGRPTGAPDSFPEIFKRISNILIYLIGAISVIMLIVGGFRYVVSGGDSAGVEGAKNTILYAIVGLVIAFLAYAAVNFIIGQIATDAT